LLETIGGILEAETTGSLMAEDGSLFFSKTPEDSVKTRGHVSQKFLRGGGKSKVKGGEGGHEGRRPTFSRGVRGTREKGAHDRAVVSLTNRGRGGNRKSEGPSAVQINTTKGEEKKATRTNGARKRIL